MPQARLPMRKILEILRLKFEQGLSGRAIALAVCAALSKVEECLRRFAASGLGWPVTLDETALKALLYPRTGMDAGMDTHPSDISDPRLRPV